MQRGEPIKLNRDVLATMIPAGDTVVLPEGAEVTIMQALGGSFTVYYAGNLARISGHDADALGHEPLEPPQLPPDASDADVEQAIWEQMKTCYDPEIPINIVDLGLIYDCDIRRLDDGSREVDIRMTLTAPGCGMGEVLAADVRDKVQAVPTVAKANVEVVFDPPWTQEMMSEAARLQTGMF